MHSSEHELVGFALDEGFGGGSAHCGGVPRKAAPFTLGKRLVERDGFEWVMVEAAGGGGWHHAVTHPARGEPVDLMTLDEAARNGGAYDRDGDGVQIVHEAHERIRYAARRAADG